ncbi:MAG: hypothetical protein NTV07_01865 [Candidatus Omnitrophica bacterium]|nr:hypothetical protein [Candidatus Omnitrophota bacterium]
MRKILLGLVFLAISAGLAYGQSAESWIVTKGYFCTLYIKDDVNIADLNNKIDTYRVDYGLTEKPKLTGQKPEDEILYKFDVIFLKVQELLDMRPPNMHPDIRIYRTKEEIDKVYVEICNEEGKFIAFYIFNLNTLYACEERVSESVIAHEIAHCVLDHHFNVAPPQKIGEMLAHYVELNLKE